MACCDECNMEVSACKPKPNPLIMMLRFAAFGAGIIIGLGGMIRERKFKYLLAWLGAWALFLSLLRYLICARCEGYGNLCYSYYIGRYTSMILPRVEGKDVGGTAMALEGLSLGSIFWLPVLALRHDRRLLTRYLVIMQLVLAGQFLHACRWCAANSTQDWKGNCPSYKTWKKLGA